MDGKREFVVVVLGRLLMIEFASSSCCLRVDQLYAQVKIGLSAAELGTWVLVCSVGRKANLQVDPVRNVLFDGWLQHAVPHHRAYLELLRSKATSTTL